MKDKPLNKCFKKWVHKDGSPLRMDEYMMYSERAYRRGMSIEEYFYLNGIKERYSTGALQNPLNNSATLTLWTRDNLFLSQWAYLEYYQQAKKLGLKTDELLIAEGFTSLQRENKTLPAGKRYTSWIDGKSGEILRRSKYVMLHGKAKQGGFTTEEFLKKQGYLKLTEPKRSDMECDSCEFECKSGEIKSN